MDIEFKIPETVSSVKLNFKMNVSEENTSKFNNYISVPLFVAGFKNVFSGTAGKVFDCKYRLFRTGGCAIIASYSGLDEITNDPVEIDKAILLSSPWSSNYYHFLIECLSRFMIVKNFMKVNSDFKLFIEFDERAMMNQFSQLLDIKTNQIIIGNQGQSTFFKHLIYPRESMCQNPYLPSLLKIRELIFNNPTMKESLGNRSYPFQFNETERFKNFKLME